MSRRNKASVAQTSPNAPSSSDLHSLRGAAAFALCYAVSDLFPSVQRMGVRISDVGFAASFIFDTPPDDEALALIARELHTLTREAPELSHGEMLAQNAAEYFRHHEQPQRADELAADPSALVSVVRCGTFMEVLESPLPESLDSVGAFKLQNLETVDRPFPDGDVYPVTTITGTAFSSKTELKAFLKLSIEAAERDHRRLGREMRLFDTHPQLGAGCWMWYPRGTAIWNTLLDWWKEQHRRQGFHFVRTPRVVRPELMDEAGLDSSAYPELDVHGTPHLLAPATIPMHALLFRGHLHSYRELPVRYAECANLYYSGDDDALWGLCRSRVYTADDAHIFCTPEQVVELLSSSLQFIQEAITLFGFRHRFCLCRRGSRFAGTKALWRKAEAWFDEALEHCGLAGIDSEEGSAYDGPKVEVQLFDALGRAWSGPAVSLDFATPERFGLRYQGDDDEMHLPLLVDRSTFGSLERFIGLLVEHFAGKLPLWLAPEQLRLLPIGTEQHAYVADVLRTCQQLGIRAEVDWRPERLAAKVFNAERDRVPVIAIAGAAEAQKRSLTLRRPGGGKRGEVCSLDTFFESMQQDIAQSGGGNEN